MYMFISDRGTVYAMGDNKMGQCGVGNSNPNIMTPTRVSNLHFLFFISFLQ